MSGRTEFWLWSGSILGAVALHGGLAALLAGTAAQAAVPPPPLRVTISAMPGADRVEDPVSTPLAGAVPVQAVASAVPIEAATTIAPQVAAPVEAIAAQDVTSLVGAPATPPPAAASPARLPLSAAGVAAVVAGAVPAGALAGPAVGASTTSPMPDVPLAATAVPVQATAAMVSQAVALAAPTTQQPPVAAAVAAPGLAGTPLGAVSAAEAKPDAVAAQPSTSAPLAAIASGGSTVAAPGSITSIAAAVVTASAPSATGPPATAPANPQNPIGTAVAVAPAGSAPQVIAGEETVLVADTPEMPVVEAPVASAVPTADALSAFLAGYDGGSCFAARVDTVDETATLSAYAVDFADSVALQLALGQSFDEPVDVSGYRAERSQCGALAFVSRLQRLVGAPLTLTLDAEHLADGETMTGTLVGPPDTTFHLFVVDDEGMVSDTDAYLDIRGASATFAFPVHLTGDAAAKLQLVIGLATDLDLSPPADRQPADPFFAALTQQLVEAGDPAAIAIAAFAVE